MPTWSLTADGFYFHPRGDGVLIGGTTVLGDDSEVPSDEVTGLLLDGNARALPGLRAVDRPRVSAQVGIRPYRPAGVRIEVEQLGRTTCTHAYGHGGAGWTLATGTARIVADLVDDQLRS